MKFETIIYSLVGNNILIGPRVKKRLEFLKDIIPATFKNRQMDDLGCGDGKTTLLLKEIFLPTRLRGFDANPRQVNRAKGRGIEAYTKDLNRDVPQGELAVMWGILHHLDDVEACLKKVEQNYDLVFIREPIKKSTIKYFGELGHPFTKHEIESQVREYMDNSKVIYYDESIFVFYTKPV